MWDKSWFGGFAQPSDYANAEAPNFNIHCILVTAIFVIPWLGFIIILPGVRNKKFESFTVFTLVMFVGASLAASLYYPEWTGGRARIVSQFRSHINERIIANLGVHVGLQSINITMKHEDSDDDSTPSSIDWSDMRYNEKFDISGVSSMSEALRAAYVHGLPYPMLSVLEYFSLNQDAFDWGRHYRTAGHYTNASVIFALCCWSVSVVFLLFLPHYFGKGFLVTGLFSLFSCLLYLILSPCQLRIGFVGVDGERLLMDMTFRWAFYLVFASGLVATISGLLLIVLQNYRFYTLSTFFEARLDETVGPRRRKCIIQQGSSTSVEVIRSHKSPTPSGRKSAKAGSSGFQSDASQNPSLSSSYCSVHELDRASPTRMPTHRTSVVELNVSSLD